MPRKQNGFGNFNVGAVKGISSSLKPSKVGAAGIYPSDRTFGSSVVRSVIEKYDLDSKWVRWRKGLEYYYRAAWYQIYKTDANGEVVLDANGNKEKAFLDSRLYQGTGYEIGSASIIKGARNLESAKKFIDFALSADVQSMSEKVKSYQVPSNKKATMAPEAPVMQTLKSSI